MTKDFTTNPATERELTLSEKLLISNMELIGAQQRLIGKISILEARIYKLEQTVDNITEQEVLSDEDTKISDKFFS